MSYNTPPTFSSGATLTAAQLNTLGDDIVALKGLSEGASLSGFAVTRLAATSINDSTWTAINFTAETLDAGGWFPGTGTTGTVPASAIPSGYTKITALALLSSEWASNATGTRQLRVNVNGSVVRTLKGPSLSGDTTVVLGTILITDLVAGDTITMDGYQSSGGALNVSNSALAILRYAPQS